MSMVGQHIVVTGGGSGVGAETARVFANAGASVTVLGRRIAQLEKLAKSIGGLPVSADVTDPAALKAALDTAREEFGPVAVAVANAGTAPSAPFEKISAHDFNETLAVNLGGVFHLWQMTLPDMKANGWGRLIAIASTAGLKGYVYVSPYCAAKHGVVGLTRSLAQEIGTSGVTANAICPGFIETPLLEKSVEAIAAKTGMTAAETHKSLLSGNPQKRFVSTREVAQTALWLCSDAAASVNGHALALSGGEV
ncbi:SDR family NAD(P)-dependent oxidoreductase [Roseobacter sp.]|uniref:SDR family NAD(P)-dependent oxidoreductase n=1 Tax=Roseobacter sp. TaxID=1907202 RepID=UPI00385DCDD0